ncbi:hypothetical protein [Fibrobacter sp.]|uniref:hypothetical protein n=1 Tax=Fibrobacter sp. TaxID=35828 RepID=UPI0025C5118B|nr:hypothetical protein [Fibrobacter sp.]MBR4006440.1 hypothetical protein [Fibrobacter sp.]
MISFKSVENFFEECTTGIEFKYEEKWYLIEFDDPFTGIGKVRIHQQDENSDSYLDDSRCEEFNDLEALVHSYKIGNRTLAEIICDENNIPRSVLPVKRKIEKWQTDLFDGAKDEK